MSFYVLVMLLFVVGGYWVATQVMPERRKASLVRPGLGDGLLARINDERHSRGLPILEVDPDLVEVAERKATHQIMTGASEDGWEYPSEYEEMFGQSLLMEALIMGPAEKIGARLGRQRELYDGEWIRAGVGVAGGKSDVLVVAIVLCREAWEQVASYESRVATRESLVVSR